MMGGGRLRASLPVYRNEALCDPQPAVNGVGRTVCGLLFRTGQGAGQFSELTRNGDAVWDGVGRGARFNQQNNPRTFTNPGGNAGPGDCSALVRATRNGLQTGYFQVGQAYDSVRAYPFLSLSGPGALFEVGFDHLAGALGNTVVRMWGSFPASTAGQQALDTGRFSFGMEIRPSDLATRMWTDPGLDPRVTGGGVFSAPGIPMTLRVRGYNEFGYQCQCGWSEVIGTREHAVNFNVPAARSVRVSVNGVVQLFAGNPYINMAAGVGAFDPAPGVWWPSAMRYEFFTAAALGGVLLADVSIPKGYGGDTIGMV